MTTGRQFRVDRGGTFTGFAVRRPDGRLLTVGRGPDAGPACCRGGGPLAVTNANVTLGPIQPAYFVRAFGPDGDQPLDPEVLEWRLPVQLDEFALRPGGGGGKWRGPPCPSTVGCPRTAGRTSAPATYSSSSPPAAGGYGPPSTQHPPASRRRDQ